MTVRVEEEDFKIKALYLRARDAGIVYASLMVT